MSHWVIVGAAFQVLGLVLAGLGARKTWREFGTEPFFEFIAAPSRRWWERMRARIWRVPKTAEGGATGTVTIRATARGRAGFRTIPEDQEVEDSISELDERTRRIMDRLQDATERAQDQMDTLKTEIESIRDEIGSYVEDLRDTDRKVATGGIRLESTGLFLVALGVVIQTLGQLAG